MIWFFWVLAMTGQPNMLEAVGQWSTRQACEEYRLEFLARHQAAGIMVTTTLCTRRYKPVMG